MDGWVGWVSEFAYCILYILLPVPCITLVSIVHHHLLEICITCVCTQAQGRGGVSAGQGMGMVQWGESESDWRQGRERGWQGEEIGSGGRPRMMVEKGGKN